MLRPYVVSETHEFHKPAQVMPGMDHYCEVTYLHAEKLPPHLQDRLTSSMIVGGWKCWQSPAWRSVFYKGNDRNDESHPIAIIGNYFSSTFAKEEPNSLLVYEYRPMSMFEVWILRLRHLGSDPFTPN